MLSKFVENVVRTLLRNKSEIHFCLGCSRKDSLQTGVLISRVESSDIRCRLKRKLLAKIFTVESLYETGYSKRIEPFRCIVGKRFYRLYRLGSRFSDSIIESVDQNTFVNVLNSLQSLKKPPSNLPKKYSACSE